MVKPEGEQCVQGPPQTNPESSEDVGRAFSCRICPISCAIQGVACKGAGRGSAEMQRQKARAANQKQTELTLLHAQALQVELSFASVHGIFMSVLILLSSAREHSMRSRYPGSIYLYAIYKVVTIAT